MIFEDRREKKNLRIPITVSEYEFIPVLYGSLDRRKKWLEETMAVRIGHNDRELWITGDENAVEQTRKVIAHLQKEYRDGQTLDDHKVRYAVEIARQESAEELEEIMQEILLLTNSGRSLKAKTLGQAKYIQEIRSKDIVFGIGPAGTGKTYLAMAMAVDAFRKKTVERIILTRPAVEAGENLGFLPGDLQEKIDPYLRPLYDALFDIMGFDTFAKLKEKGVVEVAPLAYMRGRTLDNAFIILDEAQNTSGEQMKMFLTRMGYGSKAIVTGDITQIDLPKGRISGLITVSRILRNVKGISFVYFTKSDVVRHPLVQRIIEAYEKYEDKPHHSKEETKDTKKV